MTRPDPHATARAILEAAGRQHQADLRHEHAAREALAARRALPLHWCDGCRAYHAGARCAEVGT